MAKDKSKNNESDWEKDSSKKEFDAFLKAALTTKPSKNTSKRKAKK